MLILKELILTFQIINIKININCINHFIYIWFILKVIKLFLF